MGSFVQIYCQTFHELVNLAKFMNDLFGEARKYIAGGVNSPVRAFKSVGGTPVFFTRGKGQRLYDVGGRKYTDLVLGWGPLILGHSHPAVVSAIKKTSARAQCFGAPTQDETRLAKLITSAFDGDVRIRLVNSGTEAGMSVIRLARAYRNRKLIIKFEGCYHGHSDSLLVKAGSGAISLPVSKGVPEEFTRLTRLLPYNNSEALRRFCKKYGRQVACIIVEPIAGNMGVVLPADDFIKTLNWASERFGILLIADEVITGFRFRFGPIASELGLRVDITMLGKIIGGGLPIGAYLAGKKLMGLVAPDGPVYQAGTLSGNPIAVNAGLAQLQFLKRRPQLYKKLDELGDHFVSEAKKILKNVTINRIGSMFTIFFTKEPVTDLTSALKSNTKRYAKFFHSMLRRGFYLPPSQFEAAFLSVQHTHKDIDRFLQAIRDRKPAD